MATFTAKIKVYTTLRKELVPQSYPITLNGRDLNEAIKFLEHALVRYATPANFKTEVVNMKLAYHDPNEYHPNDPNDSYNGCDDCYATPFELAFRDGHNMNVEH